VFGLVLRHGALPHERVVAARPDAVKMSQSGQSAPRATLGAPAVDVGAEELEAVGDADTRVEVAVVRDDRVPVRLDVVAARADAVEVLGTVPVVGAASVRARFGERVADEAVNDRRRRPVDGRARPDLVLGDLVAGDVLRWATAPLPRRAGASARSPSTSVLVRLVVLETREDRI